MQEHLKAVFAQSLGKQVSPVAGAKQRPEWPLYLQTHPFPLNPSWPLLEAPDLQASSWERLSTLLWLTAGPLRHEVLNPYPLHRSAPSPRSLFPVHLHLQNEETRWLYQPFYAEVWPDREVLVLPELPLTVWLTGFTEGIPANYGTLKPTLVGLEAGHLLHTLETAGNQLGYHTHTEILQQTPPEVLEDLHLDSRWQVYARADLEEGAPQDGSLKHLLSRSSGHGTTGLCSSSQLLPLDRLQRLIQSTQPFVPDVPGFRLLVSLRTDASHADLLEVQPGEALKVVQTAQPLAQLQQAYGYGALACNFSALEALFYLVVDYPEALRHQSFQAIQVMLGRYGQALSAEAARSGQFVRPARAFQEVQLDPILQLAPSEMVAYLLLLGTDRVQDLSFSLFSDPLFSEVLS